MKNIIAGLKVRVHRFTDIIDLSRFNKGKIHSCNLGKRYEIGSISKEYGCKIFVETGTYLGEMLEYQIDNFDFLYSIELSDYYYSFSKERLKKYQKIEIVKGDSSTELRRVLNGLQQEVPVLFWLDGHYSGGLTAKGVEDTPIKKELDAIFERNNCDDVILIDDANCFIGQNGYPELDAMKTICESNNRIFKCYNNIIRFLPALMERD